MDLKKRVGEFIIKEHLIKTDAGKILVTLSGGADSVALLRVLLALGYECSAIHCNFHLRGAESDRDQRFVVELCTRLGIGLRVVDFETQQYAAQQGLSIEMAARELRYNAFEEERRGGGYQAIAVAHHRDDSVETVLLNLIRGTGLKGLTGIKPRNGFIIRPLLCVSRADIEDWLRQIDQDYVTDSTNLQTDYTRNKIRHELLPAMSRINPSVASAIDSTSHRLAELGIIFDEAMKLGRERVVVRQNDSLLPESENAWSSTGQHGADITGEILQRHVLRISTAALKQEPAPVTLLHELLSPYGFNPAQTDAIMAALDAEPGRLFNAGNYTLLKDRNELIVTENNEASAFEKELLLQDGVAISLQDGRRLSVHIQQGSKISKDPMIATFDAEKLPKQLTVRPVRPGDRFVPFGMKGFKLLSDFMTDRKMNLLEKRSQLVLCSGQDIVWVMGQRTDNRFRITPETTATAVIKILYNYND